MSKQLNHLLERRQQLIRRAASERDVLAMHFATWQKPISWLDRAMNIVTSLKRHTLLVSLATLFITYRYSSTFSWLHRGLHISTLIQKLRHFLRS